VSADAFQVYEGLDLLTAQPTDSERERLEHRMVSIVPVDREFTVAEFAQRAHAEIDSLIAAGRRPIVVGGTGLYLRAALGDLDLKPPPEAGLRQELERELARLGPSALYSELPAEVAAGIHPSDRRRIVRALELERLGERVHERSDQLWSRQLRQPTTLFGLVLDREPLGARISLRIERMLAAGVAQEVERAIDRGASRTARKAIGFEELAALLRDEASLEQVAERIGRRHRQYAKRQLTWMRKLSGVELVDRGRNGTQASAAAILERLDGRVAAARPTPT
jgi:tRNA dimethylallyltransferase